MPYDLIIIGAGPSGITAAVYSARKRINFIVLTQNIGGQAAWSGDIENYTGYQFVTGPELAIKFEDHMRTYGIDVRENEDVLEVRRQDVFIPPENTPVFRPGIRDEAGFAASRMETAGFNPRSFITVRTTKAVYEAKSVIIASGKVSRELGVPGEKEYKNHGLTYCATCDGPLFSGKDVAVIGGGNSALDAALQLIRIARHVYIINNTASLAGDAVMREKLLKASNVTVVNNAAVRSIAGDKMVKGIVIVESGKAERHIAVEGVFVEIGLIPNSNFVYGVKKNALGEIVVNERNETDVRGIFAAGDVTDVPEKQIIIAAGEGSKASLSAFKYLNAN